jgi:hypothetical protein
MDRRVAYIMFPVTGLVLFTMGARREAVYVSPLVCAIAILIVDFLQRRSYRQQFVSALKHPSPDEPQVPLIVARALADFGLCSLDKAVEYLVELESRMDQDKADPGFGTSHTKRKEEIESREE